MRLRIQELCDENGISMRQFARDIGMKISELSRMNTGKANPSLKKIARIAAAFNTDYNTLIDPGIPAHGMILCQTYEEAVKHRFPTTPLERMLVADRRGTEVLGRQGKLKGSGMVLVTEWN